VKVIGFLDVPDDEDLETDGVPVGSD